MTIFITKKYNKLSNIPLFFLSKNENQNRPEHTRHKENVKHSPPMRDVLKRGNLHQSTDTETCKQRGQKL